MIDFLGKKIKIIKKTIQDHIEKYSDLRDQKKLLETIPGVGEATISQILSFVDYQRFENAKQVAAFVGLNLNSANRDLQCGDGLEYRKWAMGT